MTNLEDIRTLAEKDWSNGYSRFLKNILSIGVKKQMNCFDNEFPYMYSSNENVTWEIYKENENIE